MSTLLLYNWRTGGAESVFNHNIFVGAFLLKLIYLNRKTTLINRCSKLYTFFALNDVKKGTDKGPTFYFLFLLTSLEISVLL